MDATLSVGTELARSYISGDLVAVTPRKRTRSWRELSQVMKMDHYWKVTFECAEPVAKTGLNSMDVLMSIPWDCRGITNFLLFLHAVIITTKKYCDHPTNLNASIEDKRPILSNRKSVRF